MGFQSLEFKQFTLRMGETRMLNTSLPVGEQLNDLPMNGRSFQRLEFPGRKNRMFGYYGYNRAMKIENWTPRERSYSRTAAYAIMNLRAASPVTQLET